MRRSLLVYVLCAAVAAIGMVIPASARSAMLVKATTSTTVATDVTSSDYDSWVTITAKVTSPGATPTGSVTLTDISNGSVLATPALKNGTATFRTAALAPGSSLGFATSAQGPDHASDPFSPGGMMGMG